MVNGNSNGFDVVSHPCMSIEENSEKGTLLEFRDPHGKKLGCNAIVYGMDSRRYSEVMEEVADYRELHSDSNGEFTLTPKHTRAIAVIMASGLIKSWSGFHASGEPLEFNRENAENLFSRAHFFAEQVVEHSRERGNYYSAS